MKHGNDDLEEILGPEIMKKLKEIDDHPSQPKPDVEGLKKNAVEWHRMTIRRMLGYKGNN